MIAATRLGPRAASGGPRARSCRAFRPARKRPVGDPAGRFLVLLQESFPMDTLTASPSSTGASRVDPQIFTRQEWNTYTPEDHEVWSILYERRMADLRRNG